MARLYRDDFEFIEDVDEFDKFVLDNRQICRFENNKDSGTFTRFSFITRFNAAIIDAMSKGKDSITLTLDPSDARLLAMKGYDVEVMKTVQFGAAPYKITFGNAKYKPKGGIGTLSVIGYCPVAQ